MAFPVDCANSVDESPKELRKLHYLRELSPR